MTAGLTPNQRVIELDRAQPGRLEPSFAAVRSPIVAPTSIPARISGGRRNIPGARRSIASAVEARYGVPAKILLAIWGHETNYGSYTGDFDLARSLATLAWEGRRRELFESELIDAAQDGRPGRARARS